MDVQDVYTTRNGSSWELTDRQDPVVWGDESDGPLSREQIESYEQNGFVLMKNAFNADEVTRVLDEARRMARDYDSDADEVVTEPDEDRVRSIFRVHIRNYLCSELAADKRLAGVASQLLGSDVYVHQSRVNFKPGFTGNRFYWHSDFETWHEEDGMPRMRALSASIMLTENYPFNGSLMLVPGSQNKFVRCPGQTPEDNFEQSLQEQKVGVPPEAAIRELVEDGGIKQATAPAGSVLFFDCNVLHGSAGNMTPYPRPNAYFVFNSVHNTLRDPYSGLDPRPEYLAEREHISPIR